MVKKVLMSAMGLALVSGWWTFQEKTSSGKASGGNDRVPAKVWEGGGTTLTIDVESSDSAVLRAYFAATAENSGIPVRSLDTYEKVPAGSHSWTIDVPSAVGGDLEFQADNPKSGSRLPWTVRSGGIRRRRFRCDGARISPPYGKRSHSCDFKLLIQQPLVGFV
jgi:hypothetical protein